MAKRKEDVKLKRLEHYILNTLADGSEPVSMIYNDIFDYKLGWNKTVILKTVSDLLSSFDLLGIREEDNFPDYCVTIIEN